MGDRLQQPGVLVPHMQQARLWVWGRLRSEAIAWA